MKDLLIRQEYETMIERDLREAFPWVGNAILRPAPGHLESIRVFLQEVIEIVGEEQLLGQLQFLRISSTEDGDLAIYMDIENISEVKKLALRDMRRQVITLSRKRCIACGNDILEFQVARFCKEHADAEVLFADDLPLLDAGAAEAEIASKRSSVIESGDPLKPEEDGIVSGVDDAAAEHSNRLTKASRICLYSPQDLAKLEALAEGRESDANQRLGEVVKKLKERGNAHRTLTLIPEDWRRRLDQLAVDFPNFAEFVDFLHDQSALAEIGDGRLALPPILFDGDAGIGKTEVVLSLAEMFGTGKLVVDMASAQSGATLSGSDAFWTNTREGYLFELLAYGPTANPIVVLDELDKIFGDQRFRPDAALYQLLEPRTAAIFRDLSVRDLALDASHVLWFATTNEVERISAPLLSRFSLFRIPDPNHEQTLGIAQSIYRRMIQQHSWGAALAPEITEGVARRLADHPPRLIRTLIQRACGRAARNGRSELLADDIVTLHQGSGRSMGFLQDAA